MTARPIKVSLFLRYRAEQNFSIERLFDSIVSALPAGRFEVRRHVCPFKSEGIVRRLAIMVWAAFHQGDVNHITGDINFLGLFMRRSRTVLTIHDSASMRRLTGLNRLLYRLFWLVLPVRRAARVTVISAETLRETREYVDAAPSKFVVIPNCTPVGMSPRPQVYAGGRPRLLAVGTRPNKNLERVIEALREVSCLLVIIGELSVEQRARISRDGVEIENHLRIDDSAMSEQFAKADAVVFVSTYEGFGLPVIEAQAIGRPLITSRRSPMSDVAGAGACLVDPESVSEIRAGILRVIGDAAYRASIVDAGFRNVQAYSPAEVAKRYADVYEELYAQSAGRRARDAQSYRHPAAGAVERDLEFK